MKGLIEYLTEARLEKQYPEITSEKEYNNFKHELDEMMSYYKRTGKKFSKRDSDVKYRLREIITKYEEENGLERTI